MYKVGKTNPEWAARADFILKRAPEELYDLENDPKCLNNLIENPEHKEVIEAQREGMVLWMQTTKDPIIRTYQTYLDDFDADQLSANLEQDILDAGMIGKAPKSFKAETSKFAKPR
jgi:N-sulfoglucosamine sulfohydrolase